MTTTTPPAAELTGWHKSSHSQGQNTCVEVGTAPGWVGVRDTTLGAASPVLVVGTAGWRALLDGIRAGLPTA